MLPELTKYIGKEIMGQFKIVDIIGKGGMGAVYKAWQKNIDRYVAVKILQPRFANREDIVLRFRREARAMSKLTHPNTAKVFLYGQLDDGALYIVMEYLEGINLAQLEYSEGPLDLERAAKILIQVCGALEEAHQKGIIHRDLKPENIVITEQGGIKDFPKVLDFGLAKIKEKQIDPESKVLTREGMVFGTPEFMSPEQARGKPLDPRSDIYSLGVIFYEMLTNKLPYKAKTPMDYVTHHIKTKPTPITQYRSDLPPEIEATFSKFLAKRKEDRFSSAKEVAIHLSRYLKTDSLPQYIKEMLVSKNEKGEEEKEEKKPKVYIAPKKVDKKFIIGESTVTISKSLFIGLLFIIAFLLTLVVVLLFIIH